MRYSKMATSTATIAAIISIYLTTTGTATAGIFDDPKNLEVLPEDISAEDLRQTMRGFAQGTGSRCSACHVGKIEADLSTYDFSIDDKEKKLKARKMIQLVRDINENILVHKTSWMRPWYSSISISNTFRNRHAPMSCERRC